MSSAVLSAFSVLGDSLAGAAPAALKSFSDLAGGPSGFEPESAATGWNATPFEPWLTQAMDDASRTYYGTSAAAMGEGGTIPFMAMLGAKFPQAQFLITGVLGPHSNAHGPNEFLHLDYAKRITACVADVLGVRAGSG